MDFATLIQIQRWLCAITSALGRAVAWLTLLMVVLTSCVVLLRYGFNIGSVALQESIIYLHGIVFLLALAYTADLDQHVRVDIFYRRFAARTQAWINCLGSLIFLLPFAVYLLWVTWPFFLNALNIQETSAEAAGLPFVYVLKGLLPLAAASLVLQAMGQIIGQLGRLMLGEFEQ